MFEILYNNQNPFEGISPTPFVSKDVAPIHLSKFHGDRERISLNGVITGSQCQNENEFSGFWEKANLLVSRFSLPFKNFKIIEDFGFSSGVLTSNGRAIVRNIDFEESVFAGILPYSISLDIYKEGTFESYGILSPSKQTEYKDDENGFIVVTSETKAFGFDSSEQSLTNAKDFVNSLTGFSNLSSPLFIKNIGTGTAVLSSLTKTVNRFEGSYSVSEEWRYAKSGNYGNFSVYDTNVSLEKNNGITNVTVNGSVFGGINSPISGLRQDFNNLDILGIAENVYDAFVSGSLMSQPITKQITENVSEKRIDFSVGYSDGLDGNINLIDSLSVQIDYENNKTCATSQVTISSNSLCPSSRLQEVKSYASSFDIIDWTIDKLSEYGYSNTWKTKPTSSSSSINEANGTITKGVTICDKKITYPSNFEEFSYSVNISPSIPLFIPFQGVDCLGDYTIQKFAEPKRSNITIQGKGIYSCSTFDEAKASLKTYINSLKGTYLSSGAILTKSEISKQGEDSKEISFSFSWNEHGEGFTEVPVSSD